MAFDATQEVSPKFPHLLSKVANNQQFSNCEKDLNILIISFLGFVDSCGKW
jgi:hypothetical protein